MPKEIVPFDSFVRIHYQHLPDYVFNVWMNFGGEDNWVFLNLLQKIDDVRSRERNPKYPKEYLPKSNS